MTPRDRLERRLWLALKDLKADRHPQAGNIIRNMLDACDLYAATREVAYHDRLSHADTPGNTQLRREALTERPTR